MNKSQEIAALSKFIDSLPADSYLRHWMDHVFEEIRTDIANDIFPTATPADTRRICAEIEARGLARSKEIVSSAENEAARIIAAAKQKESDTHARIAREKAKITRAWQDFENTLC